MNGQRGREGKRWERIGEGRAVEGMGVTEKWRGNSALVVTGDRRPSLSLYHVDAAWREK